MSMAAPCVGPNTPGACGPTRPHAAMRVVDVQPATSAAVAMSSSRQTMTSSVPGDSTSRRTASPSPMRSNWIPSASSAAAAARRRTSSSARTSVTRARLWCAISKARSTVQGAPASSSGAISVTCDLASTRTRTMTARRSSSGWSASTAPSSSAGTSTAEALATARRDDGGNGFP